MEAVHVILEGVGDVLFIERLLMQIEPGLKGKFGKCPNGEPMDDGAFQPPNLSKKAKWNEKLLVLHAMNGIRNIFPLMDGILNELGTPVGEKDVHVAKNVLIVDADDAQRGNGSGGIAVAKANIQTEIGRSRALGIPCAGFAMPDNQRDGTLETLLEAMIPQAKRGVVNGCWNAFVQCAKRHGAQYDPPVKSKIDVYAKLFNRDANQGLFASSSFKDPTVWDWTVPELNALKNFLRQEVLA